jgi:hypothetical protein
MNNLLSVNCYFRAMRLCLATLADLEIEMSGALEKIISCNSLTEYYKFAPNAETKKKNLWQERNQSGAFWSSKARGGVKMIVKLQILDCWTFIYGEGRCL